VMHGPAIFCQPTTFLVASPRRGSGPPVRAPAITVVDVPLRSKTSTRGTLG
jgi:hypothetical protein